MEKQQDVAWDSKKLAARYSFPVKVWEGSSHQGGRKSKLLLSGRETRGKENGGGKKGERRKSTKMVE